MNKSNTKATTHYLSIFMDITENYKDEKMYQELEHLDELAQKCLTFSEYTNYHKQRTNNNGFKRHYRNLL